MRAARYFYQPHKFVGDVVGKRKSFIRKKPPSLRYGERYHYIFEKRIETPKCSISGGGYAWGNAGAGACRRLRKRKNVEG